MDEFEKWLDKCSKNRKLHALSMATFETCLREYREFKKKKAKK